MAKGEKDPVEELKKGVDFLFKAAKHAVEELPTEPIESLVKTSVKEDGRAMNNVKDTVLHEVAEFFRRVEFRAERQGREEHVGGQPQVLRARKGRPAWSRIITWRAAGSLSPIWLRKAAWMSRSMAGVNSSSTLDAPSTSSASCR